MTFMKTFEEKYTAWVDGKLAGAELAGFERELQGVSDAQADKLAAHRLGDLLRAHARDAVPLRNADFFNHQLLGRIAAGASRESGGAKPRHALDFWTLPRMAWSGAACLAVAAVLYFAAVPRTGRQVAQNQEYVAKILNSQTDDPAITATAYHDKEQNVTVLWLDGLDYLPAQHKLK